jgi:DNA-binding transcriptional MerR regulator/quercetin dioxygenase-like cupin family protein
MAENRKDVNQDELCFTITDVARQIGVVPATIRNWEKQGLFTAARTDSGYRVYSVDDIERLRNIRRYSKDENMGIKAIRMLCAPRQDLVSRARSGPPGEATVSKKLLSRKWKEYRLSRGYLLEDVANAAGISTSYLSMIENDQTRNVSFKVMQRLAGFYGENILYYFNGAENDQPLIRAGEGEVFSIGIDGVRVQSVSTRKEYTLSPMLYTVQAGAGRRNPVTHHGDEFMHVLAGQVKITLAGREHDLQAGDSFSFHSREPHSWYNSGRTEAKILWVYTHLESVVSSAGQ